MIRRAGRAAAWVGLLVACLVALRAAGHGSLAAPPLRSVDALMRWVDNRSPATLAMSLVRAGAEATVWYLLAVTGLHAVSGRRARIRFFADAVTVAGLDRLLRAVLGAGVLTVPTLTIAAAGASTAPSPTTPSAVLGTADGSIGGGTATMRPVEPAPAGGVAWMTPVTSDRAAEPGATTTGSSLGSGTPGPATWTCRDGRVVLDDRRRRARVGHRHRAPDRSGGRARTGGRSSRRNRHRLVDPGDPDLILPGQVFELPPVPPG